MKIRDLNWTYNTITHRQACVVHQGSKRWDVWQDAAMILEGMYAVHNFWTAIPLPEMTTLEFACWLEDKELFGR